MMIKAEPELDLAAKTLSWGKKKLLRTSVPLIYHLLLGYFNAKLRSGILFSPFISISISDMTMS